MAYNSKYTGAQVESMLDAFQDGSLKGEKGEKGERGLQGEQGIEGARGSDGARGADGKDGKNANPNRIYTTNYSYSQAQINGYAVSTYSGTWAVNETVTNTVGDIIGVSVTNTTSNGRKSIIFMTVTAISGKSITGTSICSIDSGMDGAKGEKGADGKNGADGKDGSVDDIPLATRTEDGLMSSDDKQTIDDLPEDFYDFLVQIGAAEDLSEKFKNSTETTIDATGIITARTFYTKDMFYNSQAETIITNNWDVQNLLDCSWMFSNCVKLKQIQFEDLYMGACRSFSNMFKECEELTTIEGDIGMYNAYDLSFMFYNCYKLENLTIPGGEMVQNIKYMFYGCKSLKEIDMRNSRDSKIYEAKGVFSGCINVEEISLRRIDFTNIEREMKDVFKGCVKLTRLDLDGSELPDVDLYNMGTKDCPLDHDSAVSVLNALPRTTATNRRIAFSATTKATLTTTDIAIATNKGWTIV